uniref:Uncharacterized protein n=1 Tax=Candidatus Kentrum sp. FM TaxID=2126340 RepID=A0A450T980_9GAMM|nr:MAG: hypothetical protein BECKFM1743A_GA0114220_100704 [Candidatus Kentron sp. FM]VFJ63240.1 MAG: hypothetical protein BECKFM1743C_GA0114222_103394 [Candidatus Kentron sp. FM]
MRECLGANTLVRPYAPPERRGESCIRPLCSIRPYAQKLRLHRAYFLWGALYQLVESASRGKFNTAS